MVGHVACTAIGVKHYHVGIRCPLRDTSRVLGRHNRRNGRIPTGEVIAGSCRIGRIGYLRAEVLGDRTNRTYTAVGIECNRVLVDGPLCGVGGILGGFHNVRSPAREGIAFSGHYGRYGNRTEIHIDNFAAFAAVGIKGDFVGIDGPLRGIGRIRGCRDNRRSPASEGVPRSGNRRRCGYAALIDRLHFAADTAVSVEGDLIGDGDK